MVNSSFTEDGNLGEKIPPDLRDATSHSVTSIEKQEEENSSGVGTGLQPPRLHKVDSGFISGCPSLNRQQMYEKYVKDQIAQFVTDNTSGNGHALTGICFQSKYLAIGYFSPNDSSELRFIGCDKIVLEIPEGALPGTDPQLVYMYLEMYEDNISTMSPRVNCGPDGLRFQIPVFLTIPHCAADSKRLTVKSRENTDDIWDIDKKEKAPLIESSTDTTATIQINHFTGFTLVGDGSKKLGIAVYTRADKARIYITPKYTQHVAVFRDFIDANEKRLGFGTLSPWKEFTFQPGRGKLLIKAFYQGSQTEFKAFRPLPESRVLSLSGSEFHSLELISSSSTRVELDIRLSQEYDDIYDMFCICLPGVPASAVQEPQARPRRDRSSAPNTTEDNFEESEGNVLMEGCPTHRKRGILCDCSTHAHLAVKDTRISKDSAVYSKEYKFEPLNVPDEINNLFVDQLYGY